MSKWKSKHLFLVSYVFKDCTLVKYKHQEKCCKIWLLYWKDRFKTSKAGL
jgi:hypothetical protein